MPEAPQEFVYTIYAVRVPRLGNFQWPQEHFIHTQRIGAISVHDIVRIHHIVITLRHFFNFGAANVFAVLKNEFTLAQVIPPCLEALYIQYITIDKGDVHVNRSDLILLTQVVRYKFLGTIYPVGELAYSLNVSL